MKVGVIVEGITDSVILEALIQARPRQPRVGVIHPKPDRVSGWSGVAKFLQMKGRYLGELKEYGGWDCVFVQVDADVVGAICGNAEASDQWGRAEAQLRQWAGGLSQWPQGVYPVIPVMCLETWVGAATQKFRGRNPQMECLPCAQVVAQMPDDTEREAMRQKKSRFYKEHLAPRVAENWKQVLEYCPTGAGRFEQVLQACGEEAA